MNEDTAAAAQVGATPADPVQDYRAAMREIHSNVEVRRLMFVVANVLVPTLLMASTDTLSGSNYPPELVWLPQNILLLVGLTTAVAGLLISFILGRCHMGMVINGTKMAKVTTGELRHTSLNWLGVTTNFVALSALSAALGAVLVALSLGSSTWVAAAAGLAVFALSMLVLALDHRRAQAAARRLESSWNPGTVSLELREEHAVTSLDDTTADVAVVTTMIVALFAGTFSAMTNLGSIPSTLGTKIPVEALQRYGVPVLAFFLLVSILLSMRMIARLRIALAQHATTLAELRGEQDSAWRFRPIERTFLLYLIGLLLAVASAVIGSWSLAGLQAGLINGGAVLLFGLCSYPLSLRRAARKA